MAEARAEGPVTGEIVDCIPRYSQLYFKYLRYSIFRSDSSIFLEIFIIEATSFISNEVFPPSWTIMGRLCSANSDGQACHSIDYCRYVVCNIYGHRLTVSVVMSDSTRL